MFSATLPGIKNKYTAQSLYQFHYYWMALTLILTPISTSLSSIAYLILALSSLYQITINERWPQVFHHPFTHIFWMGALLVFVGILNANATWSVSLLTAKKYLWFFITPLLFFSLEKHHAIKNRSHPFILYLGVIFITLLISFYKVSTHQFMAGFGYVFKDHIIQSLLFAIGLSIALFYFIDSKAPLMKGLFFTLCLLLCINMIFMNDGKTGYILLPLVIFYTIFFHCSFKKALLAIMLSLVFLTPAFYFSKPVQDKLQEVTHSFKTYETNKFTSLGVRLTNWRVGLSLFKQEPLLGHGTGGIQKPYEAYLTKHPIPQIHADKLLDSSYLNFALQFGLLGIAFCAYFFIGLWRLSSQLLPFEQYIARVILLAYMIILPINPWLSSSAPSHIVSLLFAFLYAGIMPNKSASIPH